MKIRQNIYFDGPGVETLHYPYISQVNVILTDIKSFHRIKRLKTNFVPGNT